MVKYQRYAHISKALGKVGPGDLNAPGHSSRLHPLFANGSIGLITAEDPHFNVEDKSGNEGLKAHFDRMGLKYHQTTGKYDKPENSFIVHNPTRQQLHVLGKKFGQEAVVYSEGGKHEMIYTNGPKEGKHVPSLPQVDFHSTQPDNYFTTLPDKSGHFTLHFDWDKLLDTPGLPSSSIQNTPTAQHISQPASSPQVANPAAKSEVLPMDIAIELKKTLEAVIKQHSPVTADDIRKSTIEMLNARIESYKDMLVGLRERELKKAEGCPASHFKNPADAAVSKYCKTCADKGHSQVTGQSRQEALEHKGMRGSGHPDARPTKKADMGSGSAGADMAMSDLGAEMTKRELCPGCTNVHSGRCGTGMKPKPGLKKEEFIDRNHEAEPGKRLKEAHSPKGVLPEDKKSKVIDSDGSGEKTTGDDVKHNVAKGALLANKPAGGAPFGNKSGGNPLIAKAAVPMAKPPAGGTGMTPKAPPMSKPAAPATPKLPSAKPAAGGMPKMPTMPTAKGEPAMFKEKQSGAASGHLEPRNTATADTTAGKAPAADAVTTSQAGAAPQSAGPHAPLFEAGRTVGVATGTFEPKRASLASIIQGAQMAKSALPASGQRYVAKSAKAAGQPGQYLADSEGLDKSAKAVGQPGQHLADSEKLDKGDYGMHDNGHAPMGPIRTPPAPKIPGKSAASIRGSKIPGILSAHSAKSPVPHQELKVPSIPGIKPPVK